MICERKSQLYCLKEATGHSTQHYQMEIISPINQGAPYCELFQGIRQRSSHPTKGIMNIYGGQAVPGQSLPLVNCSLGYIIWITA